MIRTLYAAASPYSNSAIYQSITLTKYITKSNIVKKKIILDDGSGLYYIYIYIYTSATIPSFNVDKSVQFFYYHGTREEEFGGFRAVLCGGEGGQ